MTNSGAMLVYFGGLLLGALAIILLIIGGLIAIAMGHTKGGCVCLGIGLVAAAIAAKMTGFL